MSDKYIIKNCPCYMKQPEADCWADQLSWCENYTDCLLKQIVELCKKAIKDCDKCNGDPEVDCIDCTQGGKAILAHQILELLQEVSE